MTDDRPKVMVLVGPTAVGKTETGLHLAAALPVEIVNADSMQVYRYMDIGTAKPSATERALVPHHLLDLVEPDEDFDAYRYRDLGRVAVAEVWRKRRTALVVGGTGLYVQALLHGLFPGAPRSAGIRARLRSEGKAMGAIHLFHRLAAVDPTTAGRIHCRDLVRIIRALEVWDAQEDQSQPGSVSTGSSARRIQALVIDVTRSRSTMAKNMAHSPSEAA